MSQQFKTCIVIDDEIELAKVTSEFISELGIKVQIFSSVEEALETLKTSQIDWVITDQNMPGMKGSELIENAKSLIGAKTHFTLVTGGLNPKLEGAGADSILKKPFELEDLMKIISS
jgi:CheY-like chemotaxis protein